MKNIDAIKRTLFYYIPATSDKRASTSSLSAIIGRNRSTVRKLVREMVEDGYPIGSDRDGYWVFNNRKEMQQYLNRMQAVQVALSKRIASVYHAYNKTFGGE